ncbi:MAG: hypothetical protein KDA93_27175 [Planctomycetaceae bacterium]|nr:hypothetical protein [Planctomycetaceae bacterium]
MLTTLAQANISWHLLPLAVAISLVYNSSRYEAPARILQRTVKHFVMILLVLGLILGVLVALSYKL